MGVPGNIFDDRCLALVSNEHLEAEAQRHLEALAQVCGPVTAPPVPVEDILEQYLGFGLDFDDVPRLLGGDNMISSTDVLGCTSMTARGVFVHEGQDPCEHPEQEGLYRFAISHEVAIFCCTPTTFAGGQVIPLSVGAASERHEAKCRQTASRQVC